MIGKEVVVIKGGCCHKIVLVVSNFILTKIIIFLIFTVLYINFLTT